MLAHSVFFYFFSVIAIFSSLMVITSRNTVNSVFFLILDFISVGWKKNKKLDNSNFQSTTGIWYGFFNRRDAEVWIYDTHQNAINFGEKYAEEVINKRPSQIDPTNPTQIRYHAYIISGKAMILCEDNLEDCIELINLVDE